MYISVARAQDTRAWSIDAEKSPQSAVALTELMLFANTSRLHELARKWPNGVVAVVCGAATRFALCWDDGERVLMGSADSFAAAFAEFERIVQRAQRDLAA
ncbi:MAG TPA: hypothetical protein VIG51_02725 [Candidatus Baltobacteraceae bacterium]|jgi:hypothetical protein